MNHLDKLNWRYATKKFDAERKLSSEQVQVLAEALRLSASSFGLQPWKFLIISNEQVKKDLLPHSWNQQQVVDCSHHIVFCAKKDFSAKDVENFVTSIAEVRDQNIQELEGYKQMMSGFIAAKSHEQALDWVKNQVYIALGSFLVTCAELGIDACPMEGIVASEYDKVLGLPAQGLTAVVACPVGFRAIDDKYAELAKVRFPLKDIVEMI